jgi:hypothetical protein
MFNMVRVAIGWSAIAVALMILGVDVLTMFVSGNPFNAHSIRQDWQLYSYDTYAVFQAWLVHALPMGPAGDVEVALGLWTWAAVGFAGMLIAPFRHAAALKRYEAMSQA